MDDRIRGIIDTHARLAASAASLRDNDDLYLAGMSSQASVNLMLALEDEFQIEFPDSMLRRSVFASIASIRAAVTELQSTAV